MSLKRGIQAIEPPRRLPLTKRGTDEAQQAETVKKRYTMKKYWLSSNRECAEQYAYNRAIGYLQAYKEVTKEISVDEILNYMINSANEICDELNERYPEYAAQ